MDKAVITLEAHWKWPGMGIPHGLNARRVILVQGGSCMGEGKLA